MKPVHSSGFRSSSILSSFSASFLKRASASSRGSLRKSLAWSFRVVAITFRPAGVGAPPFFASSQLAKYPSITSIMCPTRSRVSHSVQRVWTCQFFGSETMRMKFSRSRRITVMTVSLPSADIGLTGAMTAVLIPSFPSWGTDHRAVSPRRRGGRHDDRRQDLVEAVAPHLKPGRQAQRAAKLLGRLVDGEAGSVGRDLEQDAARLAIVDRLEVPAVDHRRDVAADAHQLLPPGLLRLRVGRPPGDVMDRADGFLPLRPFRRLDHVEDRVRPACSGFEARPVALLAHHPETHRARQQV